VQNLAGRFAVTGYVKNMLDGQVELVAEGEADEVDRFLASVAETMGSYTKGQRVVDETSHGFDDFTIRF
jgi:acylphosphatase